MSIKNTFRVFRGGSWNRPKTYARVAKRGMSAAACPADGVGVRLVEIVGGRVIVREQVTNSEWADFRPWHCYTPGHDNKPVTGVSYREAVEYSQWLSQTTGLRFRLITEAERVEAESTFEADFSRCSREMLPDVGTFGRNAAGVTGLLGVTYDWCLDEGDLLDG